MKTQEKINVALGLLTQMTNDLAMLNLSMELIPNKGPMGEQFQQDRVSTHKNFSDRIIEITNDLGDYFNDLDATDEDYLDRINPQFEYLNSED